MFFKQRSAANATLSYFFGCAGKAKAVAVDMVAGDEDRFIAEAEKAGARLACAVDTHVQREMAGQLYERLNTKLLALPPEREISIVRFNLGLPG